MEQHATFRMACKTGCKRFDVLLIHAENVGAPASPHRNQFDRTLVVWARRLTFALATADAAVRA